MRGFGEVACSAIDERPSPGWASRPRASRSGVSIMGAAVLEGARPPVAGLPRYVGTTLRESVVHILSTGTSSPGLESPHRRTRAQDGLMKCALHTPSPRGLD